jgi:hypothetical protein
MISRSVLGITHLLVDGKLTPLQRCPFCNFVNIHLEVIKHHIKFTLDKKHNVDVRTLDENLYIKTVRESKYGPYISKTELNLPWIDCFLCNYRDKIEFDLSLHMLEERR